MQESSTIDRAESSTIPTTSPPPRWRLADTLIVVAIVILIAIVFAQVAKYPFINYDDALYIGKDLPIASGFTPAGVSYALRSTDPPAWIPLTRLSHMLDFELFGNNAGMHHLMNVALHAAGSAMLYALLLSMTGTRWPSAIVAALYALHPLRVESVAWAAERKDVLSALMFFLTLYAYVRYSRSRSIAWYALSLVLFALGLMSKTMLVTTPFVMLLLDWWPLRRFQSNRVGRIAIEKIPFLVLSIACAVGAFVVAQQNGSLIGEMRYPFNVRFPNVPVAYARYLAKTFWPTDLAILYPFLRVGWSITVVVGSALLIVAISLIAALLVRRKSNVFVGWFWFLGMLIPVIGIVQAGDQSMADRFTLLPQIGLFLLVVFGIAQIVEGHRSAQRAMAAIAGAAIIACAVVSIRQVGIWRDSETLFRHALAVTTDNAVAHHQLGNELARQNHLDEAESEYRAALEIRPAYARAHLNLGNLMARRQQTELAEGEMRRAIELDPKLLDAHLSFAVVLMRQQKFDEARREIEAALEMKPDSAVAKRLLDQLAARRATRSTQGE